MRANNRTIYTLSFILITFKSFPANCEKKHLVKNVIFVWAWITMDVYFSPLIVPLFYIKLNYLFLTLFFFFIILFIISVRKVHGIFSFSFVNKSLRIQLQILQGAYRNLLSLLEACNIIPLKRHFYNMKKTFAFFRV